jgi:predicted tellurium resistance membrane protein TerC
LQALVSIPSLIITKKYINNMIAKINILVFKHISTIEMIGVTMRIVSFSVVSWFGPASPFLFVWILNTIDAVILSWCALVKKDRAYTLLNVFWIGVGVVGIWRAT